ncbi:MAG: ATP-binding protein [Kofleriaceae bacterium]
MEPADPKNDALHASHFFEVSLDHLCIVGFDGYFVRVSPSWTRTLGWTDDELRSMPSIDLVHPDDREKTLAGRQRLHDGALLGGLRNRYQCKDGTYRWFEWRSVAKVDRNIVYAVARDITEEILADERLLASRDAQEKLQLQLQFADRLASVGTLAAGCAHEINTPLAAVIANLAVMIEELSGLGGTVPAELTRIACEASAGAEKIRKIVRGLQTFSRASEERLVVVDVRQVIELAVALTSNELQQKARLTIDEGVVPQIFADEARFGQVIINLLVNAAQSIPAGASATNEIRVATSTDTNGSVVIEVRDTGSGIPAALLPRIFDPFFTTKPIGVGTGLGLSICHNIVTGMGGQISVTSEPGHGATFRIVVPAAPTISVLTTASVDFTDTRRGSVLVVDDDPLVGIALRRVLKNHDVTITMAAKDALALLDAGTHFDVILSDLMMPEMTGMELYEAVAGRSAEAAARIVFVSGGAFTAGAQAFLDQVPNQRIEKPFDTKAVRAIVQRFVSK